MATPPDPLLTRATGTRHFPSDLEHVWQSLPTFASNGNRTWISRTETLSPNHYAIRAPLTKVNYCLLKAHRNNPSDCKQNSPKPIDFKHCSAISIKFACTIFDF